MAASQCGQCGCRGAEGQTARALVAWQGLVNGGASQGELNLEVAANRLEAMCPCPHLLDQVNKATTGFRLWQSEPMEQQVRATPSPSVQQTL